MHITVYNTLIRKKEPLETVEKGKVKMYVCGPTVYDSCHIGHARSVVVFDVIARYLKRRGYDLVYVRNFTDVDDKIIKRAKVLGEDPLALAERYIREFHRDMDALNVERADFEPRVTEHIEDIIHLVERLIDKGCAYPVDGDVFFEVAADDAYGKLSGRRLDEMEAGARVEVDERKRHPFDFVLWKASKPGEPAWKSPWGDGRPGWHIECSAMSVKYLGQPFDIHGGGKDLIFPHHENEIAQSECAAGEQYARYWIHNGFINIHQEKMSKSLGNILLIREVLREHHPEAVRLFLLSKQYRKPIDYNPKAMRDAGLALDRLYALLARVNQVAGVAADTDIDAAADPFWEPFCSAMDDDFNTATAVGVLFEAVKGLNRQLDQRAGRPPAPEKERITAARRTILEMGAVLGILLETPETYFAQKKSAGVERTDIDPAEIEALIAERSAARAAKKWQKADAIRDKLARMKVIIEDRPDGTVWKLDA